MRRLATDQSVVDRLNAELSAIPVPRRLSQETSRGIRRPGSDRQWGGLLFAFKNAFSTRRASSAGSYDGMAIAIPLRVQRRRLLWPLIAAMVVAAAVYGPPLVRYLSGAGAEVAHLQTPTLRLSVSTTSYQLGQTVSGEVTVTSTSATTLRELSVSIFPVGARQPGVSEASVRTRLLFVPVSPSVAGSSHVYRFTWDQRRDDGTFAPRGDYVFTARLWSQTDQGNSHASMTGFANEVTVSLR